MIIVRRHASTDATSTVLLSSDTVLDSGEEIAKRKACGHIQFGPEFKTAQ